MATADTVVMGPPHSPKEDAYQAFNQIETELKRVLQHLRHDTDSSSTPVRDRAELMFVEHEPAYFERVRELSDRQLTTFSYKDLMEVRLADSAYGKHLLGKVVLPQAEEDTSFMFRAFIPGGPETATLHCIHMEEMENADGEKQFRAIFRRDDPLNFFDE